MTDQNKLPSINFLINSADGQRQPQQQQPSSSIMQPQQSFYQPQQPMSRNTTPPGFMSQQSIQPNYSVNAQYIPVQEYYMQQFQYYRNPLYPASPVPMQPGSLLPVQYVFTNSESSYQMPPYYASSMDDRKDSYQSSNASVEDDEVVIISHSKRPLPPKSKSVTPPIRTPVVSTPPIKPDMVEQNQKTLPVQIIEPIIKYETFMPKLFYSLNTNEFQVSFNEKHTPLKKFELKRQLEDYMMSDYLEICEFFDLFHPLLNSFFDEFSDYHKEKEIPRDQKRKSKMDLSSDIEIENETVELLDLENIPIEKPAYILLSLLTMEHTLPYRCLLLKIFSPLLCAQYLQTDFLGFMSQVSQNLDVPLPLSSSLPVTVHVLQAVVRLYLIYHQDAFYSFLPSNAEKYNCPLINHEIASIFEQRQVMDAFIQLTLPMRMVLLLFFISQWTQVPVFNENVSMITNNQSLIKSKESSDMKSISKINLQLAELKIQLKQKQEEEGNLYQTLLEKQQQFIDLQQKPQSKRKQPRYSAEEDYEEDEDEKTSQKNEKYKALQETLLDLKVKMQKLQLDIQYDKILQNNLTEQLAQLSSNANEDEIKVRLKMELERKKEKWFVHNQCLGYDRYHRSFWIFKSLEGVFIEGALPAEFEVFNANKVENKSNFWINYQNNQKRQWCRYTGSLETLLSHLKDPALCKQLKSNHQILYQLPATDPPALIYKVDDLRMDVIMDYIEEIDIDLEKLLKTCLMPFINRPRDERYRHFEALERFMIHKKSLADLFEHEKRHWKIIFEKVLQHVDECFKVMHGQLDVDVDGFLIEKREIKEVLPKSRKKKKPQSSQSNNQIRRSKRNISKINTTYSDDSDSEDDDDDDSQRKSRKRRHSIYESFSPLLFCFSDHDITEVPKKELSKIEKSFKDWQLLMRHSKCFSELCLYLEILCDTVEQNVDGEEVYEDQNEAS